MGEIYTAVEDEGSNIINLEDVKKIKEKTARKVKRIINQKDTENGYLISLDELESIVCKECYAKILESLDKV